MLKCVKYNPTKIASLLPKYITTPVFDFVSDLNFEPLESRLSFSCVCDKQEASSQVILYTLSFKDRYPGKFSK